MIVNPKILLIRLSSFGDIVLTFQLLKKLKENIPDCEIYYLTKNSYIDLVEMNPEIKKIITYNNNLRKTRREVNAIGFDYIIDLHRNFRSYFISIFNSRNIFRYRKNNFKKFLFVKFKINFYRNIIPVYERYLIASGNLIKEDKFRFQTKNLNFENSRLINTPYILIAPSSRHFTKIYPYENYIEIISKNPQKQYILIGDNREKDLNICNSIHSHTTNTINLCGKTDFKQLSNLIYYADYIICNDSGVLHLAEIMGKKVYVFFGSTVKEFGFYPQLRKTVIFENLNIKCRPCSRFGKSKCPKSHFKCMKEIKHSL